MGERRGKIYITSAAIASLTIDRKKSLIVDFEQNLLSEMDATTKARTSMKAADGEGI